MGQVRLVKQFAEAFHGRLVLLRSRRPIGLSDRERECLRLLREGSTPKSVAGGLGVSENRVRAILQQACRKLNSRTTTQAVAKATACGLL